MGYNRSSGVSSVAFLIALVGVICFFLPYMSIADDNVQNVLDYYGDMQLIDDTDIAVDDLANVSIFTLTKLAASYDADEKYIYGAIGAFAGLAVLFSLGKKPVLLFFSTILLAAAFLSVSQYFSTQGLEESGYEWGIAFYGYCGVIALLFIYSIRLFVAKRKDKKLSYSS